MGDIVNARIASTMLGKEDHGIMTFMLHLDFDGCGQGYGGYALDKWDASMGKRMGCAFGMEAVMSILTVAGVNKWEDLKGKYIRVKYEGSQYSSKIIEIGHIIENKWYDIAGHAKSMET